MEFQGLHIQMLGAPSALIYKETLSLSVTLKQDKINGLRKPLAPVVFAVNQTSLVHFCAPGPKARGP